LTHKQVDFELVEIDLRNKPAWYGEVSLYGKVPALEHRGQRIVESAIINEYVEEVVPEPALLPTGAGERARARILIDYANTRFVPAFGALLRAREPEEQAKAKKDLFESLAFLERNALPEGAPSPFFGGRAPGLVDFAFYPWFERWPALDHYRNVPIPAEHHRLKAWVEAASALPAARKTANAPEFYVERYARQAGAPQAAS
jgi:glutathione S-transferase